MWAWVGASVDGGCWQGRFATFCDLAAFVTRGGGRLRWLRGDQGGSPPRVGVRSAIWRWERFCHPGRDILGPWAPSGTAAARLWLRRGRRQRRLGRAGRLGTAGGTKGGKGMGRGESGFYNTTPPSLFVNCMGGIWSAGCLRIGKSFNTEWQQREIVKTTTMEPFFGKFWKYPKAKLLPEIKLPLLNLRLRNTSYINLGIWILEKIGWRVNR